MGFVKIAMQISKNCLVIHERFERHILGFEFNSVEKFDLRVGFSKQLEFESYFYVVPHVSKENNKEMG